MRLKGKVCVVTAAGQGIGAGTAQAFAREGATVWATDVDQGKLTALTGVTPRRLDVLDKAAIDDLAKETGSIDVLFNCAGFVHHGAVLDATDEQWQFAFNLNVRSMLWTIQAFLPGMLGKGGGSIVNMSSAASSVKGAALRCIYGTTKAAVIGLTKSIAVDYVSKGIRCNAICPGTVQTPSLDERIAGLGGGADARKFFLQRQPTGRFGSADEVASLAIYLASDESSFTTGTVNVIDGGVERLIVDIAAIAARAPVIPVLTIERTADAVPLARALVKGGLPVLEITLRTPVALDALRAMAAEVSGAILGAGTVLNADQLDQARRAGARFLVSPGCTKGLAAAAAAAGMPFLPGVQTVSEAMALWERGLRLMKFFPADQAGGLGWLKAVAAPLSGLRFCPTGGIGADTAPSYLALPNVACVGGSWVAPREAVAAGDWQKVERLAVAAAGLKRP